MSDATTELSLQLAVGTDDIADYLVSKLRQSLVTVDGLYSAASGHTHSGPHQGGKISSAAFNGQMDIGDYFRSTATGHAPPASGVGLEWWWDSANSRGLIQSYDHAANAQRNLFLTAAEIDFTIGGGNRAYSFAPTATGIRFWNPDNSSGGSIRTRSGNGFEFVNAAYSAVTFGVDDSGNVTIPGTLVAGATQINGTLATGGALSVGGDLNLNGHNISALGTLTGSNITLSGTASLATVTASGLITANAGLNTTTINCSVLAATSNVTAQGVVQSGAAIASMSAGDISANRGSGQGRIYFGTSQQWLGWTGGRYEFNAGGSGGQVTIWDCLGIGTTQLNTGGSAYRLTLPNNSDHTGKGIAYGWDSYSAAAGKDDIREIAEPLAIVTHPDVHGVTYKPADGGAEHVGFVADQWLVVMPSLVATDDQGNAVAMDYARVGAVTFQAVKQLAALVQTLSDRLTALEETRAP